MAKKKSGTVTGFGDTFARSFGARRIFGRLLAAGAEIPLTDPQADVRPARATETLVFEFTADEYAEIEGMARSMDMTVEEFVRCVIQRFLDQQRSGAADVPPKPQ